MRRDQRWVKVDTTLEPDIVFCIFRHPCKKYSTNHGSKKGCHAVQFHSSIIYDYERLISFFTHSKRVMVCCVLCAMKIAICFSFTTVFSSVFTAQTLLNRFALFLPLTLVAVFTIHGSNCIKWLFKWFQFSFLRAIFLCLNGS